MRAARPVVAKGLRDLSNIRKSIIGDVLVSLTKYFIHCAKCKETEPTVYGLQRYINSVCKMERAIAISKGQLHRFDQRWHGVGGLGLNEPAGSNAAPLLPYVRQ